MLNAKTPPNWLTGALVLALGYVNGMQLGKLAPYIHRLEAEQGLSLTFSGLLTSMLAVFVASMAALVGRLAWRIGPYRVLTIGAGVLAMGALAFSLAQSPQALLAARAIEGAGHVLSMVAAPAFLATAAQNRLRSTFLALWGSVVPVGFALSGFLAGSLPTGLSQSGAFLAFAVPVCVLTVLLVTLSGRANEDTKPGAADARTRGSGRIAWIAVFGFGLYVFLSIGFLTFLPAFSQTRPEGSLPPELVALLVPAGSFVTAYGLVKMGGHAALTLGRIGFFGIAVSAPFIFSTGPAVSVAAPVFAFGCGIAAASLFAAVPILAPDPASSTKTIGAVAQAGGIAALLGAPVAGFLIEQLGWTALAIWFAVAALGGAGAISVAMLRPPAAAPPGTGRPDMGVRQSQTSRVWPE